MIKSYFTKRVLKQYQMKLPSTLKANYGGSGKAGYTEGQVRTAINELKLNPAYTNYALLMFCGEQALPDETSESLLEMTKLIGIVGSGGYAGDGGGSHSDSFGGSFDIGGESDGGSGGDG